MSFKVGDTVKLKSGGPDMTVTRIGAAGGEPMVWCVWFQGSNDVHGLFPPETLKPPSADPDKTPSQPEQAITPTPERAEAVEAPREQQPTEVEGAPLTPEPVEAAQEPHPTQPDCTPVAKGDIQTQIVSLQSMISNLLKRPVDRTG